MADRHKVIIIGAGPVGSLAALYAAKRGDDVHIYELRADLRDPSTTPLNFTRSINLALSERGVNSLKLAGDDGLLDSILKDTTPMVGRMIHGRNGNGALFEESQAYDAHGRFIRAADRAGLNESLLNALEKFPNVTFHFNHKLTGADFKRRVAWFEQHAQTWDNPNTNFPQASSNHQFHKRPVEVEVDFDFLIGADGAHSATRYHMMKYARLTYEQEYIDTLWCEFHIPPLSMSNGSMQSGVKPPKFAIDPNHLHIWPAGSSMFIAIPSTDGSFTCTLFAPSSHFETICFDIPTNLLDYFNSHFPGVCPQLISKEDLQRQYETNPHLPLISIKCRPYHYRSSVAILGDAAHAMVPFYGQGMNAGLEDVRVLFEVLDKHGVYVDGHDKTSRHRARKTALEAYTAQRAPDAAAINDLAMGNYAEMRSGVKSPVYKLRKWMEETTSLYLPSFGWRTQYTRVSFENQRYSEVIKDVKHQGQILLAGLGLGTLLVGWVGLFAASRIGLWDRLTKTFFRKEM